MPTAEEVKARPDTWTPTAEEVGAATPEAVNAAKTAAVTEAKTYTNTQITDRVVYGKGKNLLKNTAKSQTINGVTFTVNEDGSVTVKGEAAKSTVLTLNRLNYAEFVGKKLSGALVDGTVSLVVSYLRSDGGWLSEKYEWGVGLTIPEVDRAAYIEIGVFVNIDTVVDNKTVYPMIRLASETDDTYEPYYEGLKDAVYKSQVVNNFTTTEEGFVADARALKVLNDTFGVVQSTTYTSEYINTPIEFYKVGKIVFMHCKGTSTKKIPAWEIWGIVPKGYRVATADGCYFIEANSIKAKMRTDASGEMKMDMDIAASTSVNFDIVYITK